MLAELAALSLNAGRSRRPRRTAIPGARRRGARPLRPRLRGRPPRARRGRARQARARRPPLGRDRGRRSVAPLGGWRRTAKHAKAVSRGRRPRVREGPRRRTRVNARRRSRSSLSLDQPFPSDAQYDRGAGFPGLARSARRAYRSTATPAFHPRARRQHHSQEHRYKPFRGHDHPPRRWALPASRRGVDHRLHVFNVPARSPHRSRAEDRRTL